MENALHRGAFVSSCFIEFIKVKRVEKKRQRDKMLGLLSSLSLFRYEFNKFNNTETRMLDSIKHMSL